MQNKIIDVIPAASGATQVRTNDNISQGPHPAGIRLEYPWNSTPTEIAAALIKMADAVGVTLVEPEA